MANDNWATPKWVMEIFKDWQDPCPWTEETPEINGLTCEWNNRTYVNPPYSKPMPWVKKAIKENKEGKLIVMLMKMDSSTEWFKLLQEAGAEFLWFNSRLHFNEEKNHAPFPSMLVVLKPSQKTGNSEVKHG